MLTLFHVSPACNHESIVQSGLRESKSGLDGAGLYLWKGTLEQAIVEAFLSLSDSHYDDKDFFASNKIDVFSVQLPEDTEDTAQWPEYGCYQLHGQTIKNIKYIGRLMDLYAGIKDPKAVKLLSR